MFKKIFGKKKEVDTDKDVLIAALLIHAAKIDENYSEDEEAFQGKALKRSRLDAMKSAFKKEKLASLAKI